MMVERKHDVTVQCVSLAALTMVKYRRRACKVRYVVMDLDMSSAAAVLFVIHSSTPPPFCSVIILSLINSPKHTSAASLWYSNSHVVSYCRYVHWRVRRLGFCSANKSSFFFCCCFCNKRKQEYTDLLSVYATGSWSSNSEELSQSCLFY